MRVQSLVILSLLVGPLLLTPRDVTAATHSTAHVAKAKAKSKVKPRRVPRRVPTRHHRSDAAFPANVESTPGYRYAQLSRAACYDELERRKLPVTRIDESYAGLDAPTRLEGALHEVRFRTSFVDASGGPSVYSLLDCRLLLALDDFSTILQKAGIVEVFFSSAYRPPPKGTPETVRGKRHHGGLAIDVHRLKSAELGWLSVETDFHGLLGAKVCGARARPPRPGTKNAALLRQLVCSAAEAHLFQSILTPNYDRPHRNHLHLELTPEVRWFLVS